MLSDRTGETCEALSPEGSCEGLSLDIQKYFQERMEQHIKKTKCKRHPQKSECLNCPYGVYVRFQNNFLVLYSVNFTMDIFSNCNINIIADVVRIQKQVAVITFTYL